MKINVHIGPDEAIEAYDTWSQWAKRQFIRNLLVVIDNDFYTDLDEFKSILSDYEEEY